MDQTQYAYGLHFAFSKLLSCSLHLCPPIVPQKNLDDIPRVQSDFAFDCIKGMSYTSLIS